MVGALFIVEFIGYCVADGEQFDRFACIFYLKVFAVQGGLYWIFSNFDDFVSLVGSAASSLCILFWLFFRIV